MGSQGRLDLSALLQRFPEHSTLLRRRVLEDVVFRELCEDYALARLTLDALNGAQTAAGQAERIAEYIGIVEELELEISESLMSARSSSVFHPRARHRPG